MGNPLKATTQEAIPPRRELDPRTIGKLRVYSTIHWRTNAPVLNIYLAGDTAIHKNHAEMSDGILGDPLVTFSPSASQTLRDEVRANIKQLETLFILTR